MSRFKLYYLQPHPTMPPSCRQPGAYKYFFSVQMHGLSEQATKCFPESCKVVSEVWRLTYFATSDGAVRPAYGTKFNAKSNSLGQPYSSSLQWVHGSKLTRTGLGLSRHIQHGRSAPPKFLPGPCLQILEFPTPQLPGIASMVLAWPKK